MGSKMLFKDERVSRAIKLYRGRIMRILPVIFDRIDHRKDKDLPKLVFQFLKCRNSISNTRNPHSLSLHTQLIQAVDLNLQPAGAVSHLDHRNRDIRLSQAMRPHRNNKAIHRNRPGLRWVMDVLLRAAVRNRDLLTAVEQIPTNCRIPHEIVESPLIRQ